MSDINPMWKQKTKIIALFGESGNGKDYWADQITAHFPATTQKIIQCTTRPPRDYEKDGVHYHFLTPETFGEKVLNGDMIEATSFNDWFYGTTLSSLSKEKVNVGVYNPEALLCLIDDPEIMLLPIYIYASPKDRLLHTLTRCDRPDCHEICRRYLADERDFAALEESLDDKSYQTFINYTERSLLDEEYIKAWCS